MEFMSTQGWALFIFEKSTLRTKEASNESRLFAKFQYTLIPGNQNII